MNKPSSFGFTLVEIMVVVIIMGLLASVVTRNVLSSIEHARQHKIKADFATLSSALQLYKMDNAFYPSEEQGLEALVDKPQRQPEPYNWRRQGDLDKLPLDPWQTPYIYLYSEHSHYNIQSLGADRQRGGQGEAKDISYRSE